MTEGTSYLKSLRTDYRDPPDLQSNQKHLLSTGKASVYELLKEIDVYYGMGDGYSYRSNGRLAANKTKHVRKPVGPSDYFLYPATVNMDYGFWTSDATLKDAKWFVPTQEFHYRTSVTSKYMDRALKTDKFFKLRQG
ncbi:hypothetical protein HHI36_002334 [Cryptolaemus montrouzieri]|uniref:Uncharacterized protein n=1 Tax=Cryptolaemus montrouzieri TaxID=559131 RepID=A0ABD2PAT7_9CUCU